MVERLLIRLSTISHHAVSRSVIERIFYIGILLVQEFAGRVALHRVHVAVHSICSLDARGGRLLSLEVKIRPFHCRPDSGVSAVTFNAEVVSTEGKAAHWGDCSIRLRICDGGAEAESIH